MLQHKQKEKIQHNNMTGLTYLEIIVNSLETFCVIGQLAANIVAICEDAVEVCPGPLDRHPRGDDEVSHHQFPLPAAHLCLEVLHVLAHQDVLKLHLKEEKVLPLEYINH